MVSDKIILTGGPGSGKTTVLHGLKDRGFNTGIDAARSIIRQRKSRGLSPRPEPAEFAKQILDIEIEQYEAAASLMFFERGIPDVLGAFIENPNYDIDAYIRRYPYHHEVFLFPAWEEIYESDDERDHTFEHAKKVYLATKAWYEKLNFNIIEMPKTSASSRVNFILERLRRRRDGHRH